MNNVKNVTFTISVEIEANDNAEAIASGIDFVAFLLNGGTGEIKTTTDRLGLIDSVLVDNEPDVNALKKAKEDNQERKI